VKRKALPKLIIIISMIVVLAMAVPFMSGCLGTSPEVEAPPEEEAPPAPEVITAKIGFNAPLTGAAAGWGLPGLYGNEIWAEHFNADGGVVLSDGTQVLVELVPYDNECVADKSVSGAKKLVLEDEVVLVQHMGGHAAIAALPFYTEHKIISTTLCPSDLTPATLYHLAPVEVHPIYMVAGIEWLAENHPELKTFAIATQDDEIGRPSMAACVAAAEAAGFEIVYAEFFDLETIDFAPVVSAILDTEPDIISWDTAYPDFVNLLTQQAYEQGFDGVLHSCAFDFYDAIIEKSSTEFMEGAVWTFPDFDDPELNPSPNPYAVIQPEDFWNEYNEDYPGLWSAVSWEYAAILDQWIQAVIYADSIEPMAVFEAWKTAPTIYHSAFGQGTWWGKPFWGIDNALMSPWPVVEMQNGKAVTVGFCDQLDWWDRNKTIMLEVNEEYGELWWQRMGLSKEAAMEQYGSEYFE